MVLLPSLSQLEQEKRCKEEHLFLLDVSESCNVVRGIRGHASDHPSACGTANTQTYTHSSPSHMLLTEWFVGTIPETSRRSHIQAFINSSTALVTPQIHKFERRQDDLLGSGSYSGWGNMGN